MDANPGGQDASRRLDAGPDPEVYLTLEESLAESIAPRRFNLFLFGTFAAAAPALHAARIDPLTAIRYE